MTALPSGVLPVLYPDIIPDEAAAALPHTEAADDGSEPAAART